MDTHSNKDYVHRIMFKSEPLAVKERIERVLGVEVFLGGPVPEYGGRWYVDFMAPKDVDLDFLRPDVLPPK